MTIRVIIGPRLDDRASGGVAGHLQIAEAQMMGAPVDSGNDGVGGPLQFVVEAPLHQPAEDRIGWFLSMQSEGADIRFVYAAAHGLVHGLDDVAPDAELAQGLIESRLQRPASRSDR